MTDVTSRAVPVGTRFTVPLGTALVLGRVHASAPGRVYCATFSPPLHADWKPAGESWWVVDDLPLRDGSWHLTAASPEPDFRPEPLRRFGGADGQRRLLISRDPVTLFATGAAEVASDDDEREWSSAPKILPSDPATFELALANTLGLPAPVRHADEKEAESRQILALLRQNVSDLNAPLTFDHALLFRDHKRARQALAAVQAAGYSAKLDAPMFRTATLQISQPALPAYPLVAAQIARWLAFAREHGGTYDGFGAALR
jgi:regulator of RNase E activity RraB